MFFPQVAEAADYATSDIKRMFQIICEFQPRWSRASPSALLAL